MGQSDLNSEVTVLGTNVLHVTVMKIIWDCPRVTIFVGGYMRVCVRAYVPACVRVCV